jgi:hypothetical protein
MPRNSVPNDSLRTIASIWQVDESKSTWLDSGFDWVPGSHLVQVRAIQKGEGNDDDRWRISVQTDFLKSVPLSDELFLKRMGMTSAHLTSTYCWVYPPAQIRKLADTQHHQISFFSSVYVGEDTLGWLPRFLAQTALMQPINAEIQSEDTPKFLHGGEPDFASGEKARVLDGILEVVAQVYAPIGTQESRWGKCPEFAAFAEQYGRSDVCFGQGDPTGLTFETPCGSDSFLVRLRSDENHPQLGSGLLVTVQVRISSTLSEIENTAALLNFAESSSWTGFPQLGCWHPRITADKSVELAHSSFIPNALYADGLATNFGLWSFARARWAKDVLWPEVEDRPMYEILQRRLNQSVDFIKTRPNQKGGAVITNETGLLPVRMLSTEPAAAQALNDLAVVLVDEFTEWFQNLGVKGALPRAFTGVTKDGKQAVIILTDLPLNHIQRREFLIWLCRNEQFVAYAYGTNVGIADNSSTITEGLEIYASSGRYDASKTLGIERQADTTIQFFNRHHAVLPARDDNGLFFGLQRSTEIINSNNDDLFRRLWRHLSSRALRRQR